MLKNYFKFHVLFAAIITNIKNQPHQKDAAMMQ